MIETISVLGKEISLYYLFWFIGLLVAFAIGLYSGKFYGFSFAKRLIYVCLDAVLGVFLMWGTSWVFGRGQMNGMNFVRVVVFVPLYIWLLTYLFEDTFWKIADFLTPVGIILTGISHIGCVFSGCCHGYPASWGIYSNEAETVCFPLQPIEAVVNVGIGVLLLVFAKKGVAQGKLYAWFMVLFGITRFLLEFLRDNEKICWNISELAMHALVAALLGGINLIIMHTRPRKEVAL